jgi:hypothetical protein
MVIILHIVSKGSIIQALYDMWKSQNYVFSTKHCILFIICLNASAVHGPSSLHKYCHTKYMFTSKLLWQL